MKPFLHYVTICFLISVAWSASIPVSEGNLSIRYNPALNHFKELPIVHQGKLIEDHKKIQMEIVKQEIEQCKERSPEGVEMVIHICLPSTSTIKEENELQHFEHIYDAERSFTLEPMLKFVQQKKLPLITCQLNPFDVIPSQDFQHTTSPLGHTYHKRAPGGQWQSIKTRWRQASPATKTKAAVGVGLGAATIGAVATPYVPPDQAVRKRSVVSSSNSDGNQSSKVSSPHEEDESVMDFGSQGAAPMRKRNLNEFIGTAGMAGMVGGMVVTPAVSGIKGMLYNHKNNNSSKNQRQAKRRELIAIEEQTGDVLLVKREPNPFILKAIKSAFKAVPETIKFVKGTVDVVKSKPKKRDLSLVEETISFDDTTFSRPTPSLLPFRKRSLQQSDYAPVLVKRLRRGGGGKKGGGLLGGLVKKVLGGLGHASTAATVVSTAGGAAATLHSGWKGSGEAAAAAAPKKRGLPQQTRRPTTLIRRAGKLGFGNKRLQNAANARKKATTQTQLKPKGAVSKPAKGKAQGGKPPAGKPQGQGQGRGRGNGAGGRGRGVGAGGGQAAGGGNGGMMSKALGGLNHAGNAAMVVSTAGGAAASLSAGWKGSGEEAAAAAAAPQKRALPQHQTKRQTMLIRRAGKLGFGNKRSQNASNTRKKAATQAQLKPKGGITKPATGKPVANKPQGGKPPAGKPQGQGQGRGRGNGGGGRGRGRGGAGGGAAAGGGGGMSTGDKLQAGVGAAMSASMVASAVGDVKSWVGGSGGEQQAAPAAKRKRALMFNELDEYDTMMIKKRFKVPKEEEEVEIINYEIHKQPDFNLISIDEQQSKALQLVKRGPGGNRGGGGRPRPNGGGGGGLGAKAGAALEVAGSASMVGGMLTPVFEPAGKAIHNVWNKITGGGKKKAA